jgi:hypothetical protein
MNYRSYQENIPIITPMYYQYPEEEAAYKVKNQYLFGSELIVAAVTTPRIKKLNAAKTRVWLPDGIWHDIHTGIMYDGNRELDMYRKLEEIPVLAKAGSILPFTDEISAQQAGKNPESLRIKVFSGGEGNFCLYEDDNETCEYERGICVTTKLEYTEKADTVFIIHSSEGNLSLIPKKRSYIVEFYGFNQDTFVQLHIDGNVSDARTEYQAKRQKLIVHVPETEVVKEISINLGRDKQIKKNQTLRIAFDFLNQAEINFLQKDEIFLMLKDETRLPVLMSSLKAKNLDDDLYGILMEIMTARV